MAAWLKKPLCLSFQASGHFSHPNFLGIRLQDINADEACCDAFPQTFSQREKRQQLQEKRKALKDARLAKVRQRKLQKLKEAGSEETSKELNLAEFDFDSTGKKDDGKSHF